MMIGGVKCGGKLKYFLLGLFLLSPVFLFSLSQEEIKTLPLLDKETLIEIILTYDQGFGELEISLIERQKELEQKENELNEIKKLLKTQEALYQISYETQKKLLNKNNNLTVWLYIAGGAILAETVFIIGGFTGQ